MPSTGNKATTPFKTMDIKSALISAGSRKRKAPSPQVCKSDAKNVKLSLDNEDEKDAEILDEVCGITVTLDKSALQVSHGDCKENKDINTASTILETHLSPELKDGKDNLIAEKDELSTSLNKTPPTIKVACLSPKSTQNNIDMDLDQSLSDKSKISDNSSCDELDTSVMNSSINVSLNTSGHSVTGDDCDEKDVKTNSKNPAEGIEKADGSIENNKVKEKSKKRKMTPAEAKQKAEEREQKHKERLLKKQELESKKKEKLIEKERRNLERQMREQERKERERIKQEKKEQEEKERLLRQKEKEEKLQQKLEEKKKKEELKQKREEEQRKAEEEKLRLKLEKEQKEKEKKEKAEKERSIFRNFFVKGDTTTSNPPEKVTEKEGAFLPFQVSDDMILAPVVPPAAQERFDRKQLDHCLEHQDGKELYLQILKTGSYKDVRLRKRNRRLAASEADVIVIDKNAQAELGLSAKLLQFCENVRPPYWGTWRKKSKNILPRRPFGEDELFDYSVDSDDEWDEGGPGESLSGTEPEDESDDDYEVDNEFFVPHGYLSDEEEKKEDDDEEVNDPEKQKALLKLKLMEFEMERKKKTTELKPIILGCYFTNVPSFQDAGLQKFLQTFSAEMLSESPIPTYLSIKKDQSASGLSTAESPKSSNTGAKKKKNPVPEEAIPQLIRLVHGNTRNINIMAEAFQKFWLEQYCDSSEVKQEIVDQPTNIEIEPSKDVVTESAIDSGQISLRQLRITIKKIATYGKPPEPTVNKCCWWVHDDFREKYGLMDAPFPNQWSYYSKGEEKKPLKGPSVK